MHLSVLPRVSWLRVFNAVLNWPAQVARNGEQRDDLPKEDGLWPACPPNSKLPVH